MYETSEEGRRDELMISIHPYKRGFFAQASTFTYFFRTEDLSCWRFMPNSSADEKYIVSQVDYGASYIVAGEGVPADDVDLKIRQILDLLL